MIDRIFAKMVMVMFYPMWDERHNLFYFPIEYVFPWPDIAQVEYPAEQENGVEVPALPAL